MSESSLPRRFGLWTGTLVTVASMVGVGILTTSGYTIRDTESPSTLLLLWTIGGVLSLCGALTFAELATRLPRAGGDYVFVRSAYGDGVGFMYGWATFLLGFAGPTALISHACVVYLTMPMQRSVTDGGGTWPEWVTPLGATLIILAFTGVHCRGQRSSRSVQNSTTLFKFVLLVLFVIAGWSFGGDWANLTAGRSLGEQDLGTAVTSLIYVFYAYSGWNASVYLAGEIDDPGKTLPRAILAGCLIVTLLYLAMNVTYVLGIGPEGLRGATHAEVEAIAETAGRQMFGSRVSGALSVLIGCGILASVSAYLLTGSRICYAMANDGLFLSYAGRLSGRTEAPAAAIVTLGFASAGLIWGSQIVAGAADAFQSLLGYTSVGLVLLTSLAVASLFVLRRRDETVPSFRVPLYPLPPLLFLSVTSVLMYFAIQGDPTGTLWGTASVLSGWPLYWATRVWRRRWEKGV